MGAQDSRSGGDRIPRRTRRRSLSDGSDRRGIGSDDPETCKSLGIGLIMQYTFIALVENKPGVLNRVASLFRRRNFNIESLAVGKTENPEVSRMTVVVGCQNGE